MEQSLNLQELARSIADQDGDKGAMIISASADGVIRIGVNGLDSDELRDVLCAAIHLSYVFDDDIEFEDESDNSKKEN
jgi:hypothetical protein